MAALVVAWKAIRDAHVEAIHTPGEHGEPVGTGRCVDCGRSFPCGPHQMAAQILRDDERLAAAGSAS
ncbi:hypothetical protein [Actinorhabdospora filicis]|nr:hypothetical protein [Actinorhabdospora filicis]